MYQKKDKNNQHKIKFVCIEELVPEDHILRDLEKSVNFNFIYDEVKGPYSEID